MRKKFGKNLISKLVITTVLANAGCGFAFAQADFTYFDTNPNKQIKLVNPIYLDTTKASHPTIKLKSTGENNLSTLQQKQKNTTQSPKFIQLEDAFSPISDVNGVRPNEKFETVSDQESPPKPEKTKAETIIPQINNAFAPPTEEIQEPPQQSEETFVENIPTLRDKAITPEKEQKTEYYVSVQEEPDVDFNGKVISKITITGLKNIDKEFVLSKISSGNGSVFVPEKLQQDLQNIYATGFFSDNMSITPIISENGTVELEFVLEENLIVSNVSIVGNTVISTSELTPLVKDLKGLPQNLNLINEAIENINNCYHKHGYLLASVSNVDDTADGQLTFCITEGIIEKIVFEGNKKTKEYVIERNIMTQPGTVYNEEYIKKDISKLYSTQIFKEVDRNISPSPDKDGEYIVTIKVIEDSYNSLSIGGGIDNAIGAFGSIGYNEKNFLGRGQKFGVSGMLGSGILLSDSSIKNRMNWSFEMNWMEPYFLNEDTSLAAKLFYRDLGSYQIPLAIERRFGASTNLEHKIKGVNNLSTNLGIGFEHIHLKEGDEAKIKEIYKANNINFARRKEQLEGGSFINISPGIKYSTLDDEFMPRDGLIAKANFIEAFCVDNVHHTNGRAIGAITKYIPLFEKSTLSIGAKGGVKVHGKEMPEIMAFRLGGPYSVRGFKMNGVGTGNHFIMGSAELQTPIPFFDRFKYDILKNMRFAFFVDAGRVYSPTISSDLYDRPLSAISGGVGLRVNIPNLGPITVDYGIPITNPGRYGKRSGQFTFGASGYYDSYY